ncbi:MAG: hypothetical protein E7495_05810 [Ruminococcus flavefaciens]|jgi:hypothetical protein|nr:hypothetical protein [Ruminococcus flavefaciens]
MKKRLINRLITVVTSLAIVLLINTCFPNNIIDTNSVTSSTSSDSFAVSETETENPFNYQDDNIVEYNRKSWVQPSEWNCPKIDPKNYNGSIMLYFDRIGLEPEYSKGKVQRVYFSMTDATEPVSSIKFHFFYDTRLKVKPDSNGNYITARDGLNGFTTGSAMVEEGQLVFYATSSTDKLLSAGCIFTVDFIVPENAEPGDLYPFGLAYVNDGIATDTFINSAKDDAGKLQMTYVFTKGIYNGYIRINGEKKPATTTAPETESSIYAESYELEDGYYFSHDDGVSTGLGFSKKMLKSLKLVEKADGKEVVKVLGKDIDINDISFNGATPANTYDSNNKTFKYEVPIYIGKTPLVTKDGKPVCATVYIGIKGDTNLDNRLNVTDATFTLRYVKALNDPVLINDPDAPYKLRLNSRIDYGTDSDLEELSAFLADADQNEYDVNNWKTKKNGRRFNVTDASMLLNWIKLYNTEKANHNNAEPSDSTRYALWVNATAGKNRG